MGIKCEINLFKHPDNAYTPNSTVSGNVKYVLSEESVFSRITVSLKGLGHLEVVRRIHSGNSQIVQYHKNKETYVDIDDIVLDDTKKVPVLSGDHEIPFSFTLPESIPPTFKYKKYLSGYEVTCKISYYIRVKFEKPGFLNFDKRFKTKIKVASIVNPTMPTTPVAYAFEKKPFHPLLKKDRVVKINGTVENSITQPGGKVKINYEVINNTKLDIKEVKIKLTQDTTFYCGRTFPDQTEEVKLTDWRATPVKAGDTQVMALVIDTPLEVSNIQNSKLVSRNYCINVVAELPIPHRNVVLKMPIEIIDERDESAVNFDHDLPPSYSEAMKEYKKDDLD